jgi:formate-dependent nitrite reductase membrane component NrfD
MRAPSRAVAPTMVEEYVDGRAPANQAGAAALATPVAYYDYPPLKKPHWKPYIPAYFFVGGVAAGAALVGALAELFGSRRARPIGRAARLMSAPLVALGQLLLIADLGRPERGPNMFRIVKPRSPMSMGTWGLATFSLVTGTQFVGEVAAKMTGPGVVSRLLGLLAQPLAAIVIPPALFVGGYTGVLLSATSVPLWSAARRHLAPLFVSSAVATGSAALALATANALAEPGRRGLATTMAAGIVAEAAVGAAMERQLGKSRRHLDEGPNATLHRTGQLVGLVAPLVLVGPGLARGTAPRPLLVAAAMLALVGGCAMRFSIVGAGKHSADDAASYWERTS